MQDGDGIVLFLSRQWGGQKLTGQICPTLKAEKVDAGVIRICATRGRDRENPKYRGPATPTFEQRLELGGGDITHPDIGSKR